MQQIRPGLAFAAVLAIGAAGTRADTSWLGVTGSWGDAQNWTAGVPGDSGASGFGRNTANNVVTIDSTAVGFRYMEFYQAADETLASYTFGSAGVNAGPAMTLGGTSGAPVIRLAAGPGGNVPSTAGGVGVNANVTMTFNAPILFNNGSGSFFNNAHDDTARFVINGDISNVHTATSTLVLSGAYTLTETQGTAANIIHGVVKDGTSPQRLTMSADRGSWELTAHNTYTGLTLVSGSGTLFVTGSIADGTATGGSYDVQVNDGTLAGTGTIYGRTTINSNGSIGPGKNGIGTLHLGDDTHAGDLRFNADTVKAKFDIASADSADKIESTGLVTFEGTLELNFTDPLIQGTWTLFDAASYAGAFDAVTHNLGAARNGDVSFNNTTGVLTVVPEPSSLAAALAGCGLLIRRRRSPRG